MQAVVYPSISFHKSYQPLHGTSHKTPPLSVFRVAGSLHSCYLVAADPDSLPTTMLLVEGNHYATLGLVKSALQPPSGYPELLQDLKTRIRGAQVRAALAVNRELVLLYWSIGRDILARQGNEGWGTKVIERLAHDLQMEFPGVEGFSSRSLKYMRALAEAWPDEAIVQQLIA